MSDSFENARTEILNLVRSADWGGLVNLTDNLVSIFPASAFIYKMNGLALSKLGKILEAEASFNNAIKFDAQDAELYKNIAVLNYQSGKNEAALENLNKALEIRPRYAEVHNYIGLLMQSKKETKKATEYYMMAIECDENYSEAYFNLGNLMFEIGQHGKAVDAFGQAILKNHKFAKAYNNLGLVFQDLGNFVLAKTNFLRTIELMPDFATAHFNLGNVHKILGEPLLAIASYSHAVQLRPDFAEAWSNMGIAHVEIGEKQKAILAYSKALEIKPNFAEAHFNLGNLLKNLARYEQAIKSYDKAISLKPNYADAYNNKGLILQEINQPIQAISLYLKSLTVKPDSAAAWNNIGTAYQEIGSADRAIIAYNKAIEINPNYADAHRHLSLLVKYEDGDTKITHVSELLKSERISDIDKCHFHFTLAKMQEDLGNIDNAFQNYVAGGALRRVLLRYDREHDKKIFDKIYEIGEQLKSMCDFVPQLDLQNIPIFIVGMPRSGTTLVEQIISCHSMIEGGGELPHVGQICENIISRSTSITLAQLQDFRINYLNSLRKLSNGKRFVTDKTPLNFRYIGLIRLAIPEAKIIHVTRDPSATCWSNFKHYFISRGMGYSYDLKDTVNFYKDYRKLMTLWNSQHSEEIYELDYEKLVKHQEMETKNLIDFLGVDWERSCMLPHKNLRSVRTASQQQVRRTIYENSSKDWKKYQGLLENIFGELHSFASSSNQ